MLTVAVVNLKGGSAKTTTSGFLAAAFAELDMSVIGVDADGENESWQGWAELAEPSLPYPVMSLPKSDLHRQLPGIVGARYDVAVIDTPPMQAQKGTVQSALRLADVAVLPMAPTAIEHDRITTVREIVEATADLRRDETAPAFAVLLNRCKPRAASTGTYRDLLEDDGVRVLKAQVGNLERFAQAWGEPIKNALNTSYGDAVEELLEVAS